MIDLGAFRLTQYARGGGCACKIPPGELEQTVAGLVPDGPAADLIVGVEHGDDGAVVRVGPALAVVVTADFFTPVVDDAYTFGRIAATNALSDVYAMGGEPLVALNLLGWPRDKLPAELAAEVLRGGLDAGRAAGCHVAGGHSIDDPEPKYGMAVTGTADPDRLLRIDAGRPGQPLCLTKPVGTGVLNAWHKATGQVSAAAIDVMTTLNADASRQALAAGIGCATDVTGFGLLGHLFADPGQRGSRGPRPRGGAAGRGIPAAAAAGHIPGGPAATWTGCYRTPTPAPPATRTCCCSPTRRPPAGCSWPGDCPEHQWSGNWSRAATPCSSSDSAHGDQVFIKRRFIACRLPRGCRGRGLVPFCCGGLTGIGSCLAPGAWGCRAARVMTSVGNGEAQLLHARRGGQGCGFW